MLRRVAIAGVVLGCAPSAERRPAPAREGRPIAAAPIAGAPAVPDAAPATPDAAPAARAAPAPDGPAPDGPAPDRPPPRDDDLVDVSALIPDAVLDMRYATADNFTGVVLYPRAVCKLRRAVAARLVKAAAALRADGRRLLIWDCYRPSSIQERLWTLVPDPRYVADPKKGSRHGRGAAVDVALVDAAGRPVVLPTKFDEFTEAAHRARALAGPRGAEARRLEAAMLDAGFLGIPTEWWHFDAPDSGQYALSNEPL